MANYPSFDEFYRPQFRTTLEAEFLKVEDAVSQTRKTTNPDDAERLLEKACDELKSNCNKKIDEVKEAVKQKRPKNPTAEQEQQYAKFIGAMTVGFRTINGVLDTIFQHLQMLIATVTYWIRQGIGWAASTVSDTFSAIRSLYS